MVLCKVFQSALFCHPPTIKECGKLYLCICVFVCVYLDVRHLGTLFLRSSYHLLFKNISHHGSFQSVSKFLILLPTNHKRGIKKGPEPREGTTFERNFFWILLKQGKPPSKTRCSHLHKTKKRLVNRCSFTPRDDS